MSTFDQKPLSEPDAFKLAEATKEEASSYQNDVPTSAPRTFDPQSSPIAKVVEQIMSHWADVDESWVRDVARESGDPKLQRLAGQVQSSDLRPSEGLAGDFKADSEGPAEGLDVPPRAGGGEFGGGGGGGDGSGDGSSELSGWIQGGGGGMGGDPGNLPDGADRQPGYVAEMQAVVATYGGGGGGGGADGDGENPLTPPPKDPKKPKKP